MFSNFLRALAAVILLIGVALAQVQNGETSPSVPQSAAAPAKAQFFSGTVTQLDKKHITVSRTLVGKPAETRVFLIQPATKVAKSVKAKAKVTVRYTHEKSGDVALEVQVRSNWRFSRS